MSTPKNMSGGADATAAMRKKQKANATARGTKQKKGSAESNAKMHKAKFQKNASDSKSEAMADMQF